MSAVKRRTPFVRNAAIAAVAAVLVAAIIVSWLVPMKAGAYLSRSRVLIGDTIRYVLTADMRNGFILAEPDLDRNFAAFSIRDKKRTIENVLDRKVMRYIYFIANDEPGEYDIAPFTLRYKSPGEPSWSEKTVRGFHVTVRGILASDAAHKTKVTVDSRVMEYDTPFNYDIKDSVAPKNILTLQDIVFIALSVAAVLIVLFAAATFFYDRAFRKKPIPQTPDTIARGRLAELRASGQALRPKDFCLKLSGILKDYIRARFNMEGQEKTTKEFLAELDGISAAAACKEKAGEILMLCDLVKYSGYASSESELSAAADSVNSIITGMQ